MSVFSSHVANTELIKAPVVAIYSPSFGFRVWPDP